MTPVGGIVRLGLNTCISIEWVKMVLLYTYTEAVSNMTIDFRWTIYLNCLGYVTPSSGSIKYTENPLDTNIPILIKNIEVRIISNVMQLR